MAKKNLTKVGYQPTRLFEVLMNANKISGRYGVTRCLPDGYQKTSLPDKKALHIFDYMILN